MPRPREKKRPASSRQRAVDANGIASPQPAAALAEQVLPHQSQRDQVLIALQGADTVLLTTHVRPDGDAIGSVMGLARALRKAGKRVDVTLADLPPPSFRFLLRDEVLYIPGQGEGVHDVVTVLDAGDVERTGLGDELTEAGGMLINIDHHATNTQFGEINFVDTRATSTCELITDLLVAGDLPLDVEVAEPLYLGLCTDTRFFQNDSVGVSAFDTASRLLRTGLDASTVLRHLNGKSLADLKVLGLGLGKLQIVDDGKLLWLALSQSDLRSCKAKMGHVWSCGLIGHTSSLEGGRMGLVIVEGEDGRTYCEFRGREGYDVSGIAVHFGGGGHRAASGCSLAVPFAEVVASVVAYCERHVAGTISHA